MLRSADISSFSDPTATRIWVADQFTALIRNGAIPKTDAWVKEVLDFFVLHSLFGIRKKNEKSTNRWVRLSVRITRFSRA